ncbi:MAG: MBL fold metallo-hydrolase [Candidatus Thiodiazotropha sp. (ex Lucinoma aequizonata)]|nr:MBL fold metallo-hydrolase [Candidatus Thiodiazotropha sp. (ex Lucinoma aequizonata)]MCU7893595.1 MBL fold metallo-hydrolase [Candidatus Thiodiazotropha sp. (ex Lucinoma aequizonata)]MCU7897908.1 MBL fold metallo-hydrolase [Candidatus Thiodiazotropha sp. (ex Lucinoma aequizonata)]MCU7903341.1 MBL fold metallo-hydrolase [Candidatus Thiodiazotropha sp. (ex Lucinoma aequizonata)]
MLVDCGFSAREVEHRLTGLGVDPDSLTGILITYEHSDHVQDIGPWRDAMGCPCG